MLNNLGINAWFVFNHVNLLIPYVKVIPTGAIPTIIQGSVTVNSTTYAIYSYELLNGTVISFWVLIISPKFTLTSQQHLELAKNMVKLA